MCMYCILMGHNDCVVEHISDENLINQIDAMTTYFFSSSFCSSFCRCAHSFWSKFMYCDKVYSSQFNMLNRSTQSNWSGIDKSEQEHIEQGCFFAKQSHENCNIFSILALKRAISNGTCYCTRWSAHVHCAHHTCAISSLSHYSRFRVHSCRNHNQYRLRFSSYSKYVCVFVETKL